MMASIRRFLWEKRLSAISDIIPQFHQFKHLQRLSDEQLKALCHDKLKRLLQHAYHHVPYYHDILHDTGVFSGAGEVDLGNFTRIPLLNKPVIRKHYERLRSDDLSTRKWCENTSGGSTGEPVKLIQETNSPFITALVILYDLWSGYSMGERRIVLWGSERDLFAGKSSFRTSLGRWLKNEIWLNAFRITPEQMQAYVKCINDFKPVQILAYVESIYELSRFIEREKQNVYSPRSIMVSAGVLHSHMRETIERVFKAPVFNRYGSREVGSVACECDRHQGLHISSLTHYVEILRHDGSPAAPGELGEIVITLLTNYAMPLIRYRIGDMGVLSENQCTCGRAWPLLKQVTGRVSDVFRTKTGTQVHGEYFTHLFYFRNWLNKFQVIQEDVDFIHVLIIPEGQTGKEQELYAKELDEISEKIRLVMGQDCKIEYEFVDDITPTTSGKYRYTISKVEN